MPPLSTLTARETHVIPLHPAALASVPYGLVLVRVLQTELMAPTGRPALFIWGVIPEFNLNWQFTHGPSSLPLFKLCYRNLALPNQAALLRETRTPLLGSLDSDRGKGKSQHRTSLLLERQKAHLGGSVAIYGFWVLHALHTVPYETAHVS